MENMLVKYLGDQPLMAVLRGLILSSTPRHIRGLASQYSLSASGVSDIIRRLKEIKILKETKIKNKRCYTLDITEDERLCLKSFFDIYEKQFLQARARRYSKGAIDKLKWMDESYSFYKSIKQRKK